MHKKTMLLASMAVAAMAMAIPALASAQWTHGTEPIGGNVAVTFAGNASFTSAIGGVSCTSSTSEGIAKPGTTGTITEFGATGCKGTGGLAGCTVTKVEPTTLPWVVHIKETKDVEITTVNIDNTFHGAFCPYHQLTLWGNVTATPHNGEDLHKIHHLNVGNGSGHALEAYNGTTGNTVSTITAAGTFSVTPATTYGIT